MKGTLNKSHLTLQRERSDHRRAVITGGRQVPLSFPPQGTSAGPWSVSISAFLSRKGRSICGEEDTRSPGSSSRRTHGVAVACLGRHTKELRNGRGSMPVLGGPTSLCVCLWEFNKGQGFALWTLFSPHTPFASCSYTSNSYRIFCLGLVTTPTWAMPPVYAYSLPL